MQESHTPFGAGERVTVRDDAWVVLNAEAFDDAHVVHLRGIGSSNQGAVQSFLTPFDRIERVAPSTRLRAVSRRRALAAAALHAVEASSWGESWTAAAADIELRAWQLEPALAAVKGATRILLADRVGLGKTIQAALIVSELLARGLADRVLVLTPASLRGQWAHELSSRFSLTATVFDHASLSAAIASLPVGVNPWQTAPLIVSSIDLVKRPEVRSAIDEIAFDVLVVDEAHHVTPATDRGSIVADLAARTPWVVLVTATPHSGDEAAFQFLQQIGSTRGGDLLMFRRSSNQPGRLPRRARLFAVTPTDAERALLEEISLYVRAIQRAGSDSRGTRLVASVIARRAASSAKALCGTLMRRIALLSQQATPEVQPCLPWEDGEATDGDTSDVLLATPALSNVEHEVAWLRRLLLLAEQATAHPSKIAVICRLLRRTSESVLVFSEYRDVAIFVSAAIEELTTVAVLHGGLSPRQRQDVVTAFTRGQVRTLVATDAAGEGLNLHHRCRLVVNVELPWMPRRLEQRIGRVDRIGQTRRVHALQLVHRGSFEGTVVARLERRRSLADARAADDDAIERDTQAAVARRLRQAAGRTSTLTPSGALFVSRATRRQPLGRINLLYGATLLNDEGGLVQRILVPVVIGGGAFVCADRSITRGMLRRIASQPRLREAVEAVVGRQRAQSQEAIQHIAAAIADRLDACLKATAHNAAQRRLWQGSLFDRSVDVVVERREAAIASIRERLGRRRAEAQALSRLHVSDLRLLVAWPAN